MYLQEIESCTRYSGLTASSPSPLLATNSRPSGWGPGSTCQPLLLISDPPFSVSLCGVLDTALKLGLTLGLTLGCSLGTGSAHKEFRAKSRTITLCTGPVTRRAGVVTLFALQMFSAAYKCRLGHIFENFTPNELSLTILHNDWHCSHCSEAAVGLPRHVLSVDSCRLIPL